jgi:hypothetical protein
LKDIKALFKEQFGSLSGVATTNARLTKYAEAPEPPRVISITDKSDKYEAFNQSLKDLKDLMDRQLNSFNGKLATTNKNLSD